MALGKRTPAPQPLFVLTSTLPQNAAHPFYAGVNRVLDAHQFDQ